MLMEATHPCQGMGSLFAMATKQEQRSIILMGKEFKTGRIFERVYGVLFHKPDTIWALKSVEVRKDILNERRTGHAAEKKGALWILDDLRFALSKCSLRPCIFGLSNLDQRVPVSIFGNDSTCIVCNILNDRKFFVAPVWGQDFFPISKS